MVPKKFESEFMEYIAYGRNRFEYLKRYLAFNGVKTSVVYLAGTQNLLVNLPETSFDPTFKIKTVVSHYDRVSGTPGANDNSAANFALADFAIRLSKNPNKVHNTRIVFTDCEELGVQDIKKTGAFQLGNYFRGLGMKCDDFFVFDACGKGDVAILGKVGNVGKNVPNGAIVQRKLNVLAGRTENLFKEIGINWLSLPIPMSDNVAFIENGIPAVCISILPSDEATCYAKSFIQRKIAFPKSWSKFHTHADNIDNVDENAFLLMEKILDKIADLKIMA